jgi:hypothetical protein
VMIRPHVRDHAKASLVPQSSHSATGTPLVMLPIRNLLPYS